MLALILFLLVSDWKTGLVVGVVFLLSALLESTIKKFVKRPRPFETITEIPVEQPRKPRDSSFPSGDCLRIWFLALTFPFIFHFSWFLILPSLLLAVFVSFGRIGLGVHYFLDVLAGTGMGVFFAGVFWLVFPFL